MASLLFVHYLIVFIIMLCRKSNHCLGYIQRQCFFEGMKHYIDPALHSQGGGWGVWQTYKVQAYHTRIQGSCPDSCLYFGSGN